MDMKKGSEVLKALEEHCQEELTCSKRLRFQIEQSLQRLIDKEMSLRFRIGAVLDGHNTFDPKNEKAISRPRK